MKAADAIISAQVVNAAELKPGPAGTFITPVETAGVLVEGEGLPTVTRLFCGGCNLLLEPIEGAPGTTPPAVFIGRRARMAVCLFCCLAAAEKLSQAVSTEQVGTSVEPETVQIDELPEPEVTP